MNFVIFPASIALSLLLSGCNRPAVSATTEIGSSQAIEKVSIATLFASPEYYQGKTVRLTGPAVGIFESSFICDDLPTIAHGSIKQCLWVEPGHLKPSEYHKKIIELVGRFDRDWHGHMGTFGATIWASEFTVLGKHDYGDIPPPPAPAPP